jgi:hypothetical protein
MGPVTALAGALEKTMAELTANTLAHLGVDSCPSHRPAQQRGMVRVTPDKIIYIGGGRS